MAQQGHEPPAAKIFESLTGLPSPEKMIAEFQQFTTELRRLNNNIERALPDIHTLANSNIGGLTQVIRDSKLPEGIKVLQNLYSRLWGR